MATNASAPSAGRLFLNVVSNWGGQFSLIFISFFLAPFVVRHLGDSAYGVWTLIRALAGYLALMDLGIRGAVTRYIARFLAQADHESASKTVASALRIFAVLAMAAVLMSLFTTFFLVDGFRIPAEYKTAAQIISILAGLHVAVTLFAGVYAGIVAGLQRFDILNTVEITIGVANALAVFIALFQGYGIVAMAVVQLCASACRLLVLLLICRWLCPMIRLSPLGGNQVFAKMIFIFSAFSFVMQVSGSLIYYCDAAVIATYLPIQFLTWFTIGGTLVEYTRMLVSAISQTISPLASAVEALDRRSELKRLLLSSAAFGTMAVLPIAVTFLIRGRSFIGLWMGPSYAEPAGEVLSILTLPLLLHAGAHGTGGILMGIGKHRPLAPAMLIEGLCNLLLSVVLVKRFGLTGVAWGTAIPNMASALLFWPWYLCRTFNVGFLRFASTVWLQPALAMIPFALASLAVEHFWPATTLYGFMLQVGACLPLALFGFWHACMDPGHREQARHLVRRHLGIPFLESPV
jgi:O-antigen/teichoic acid export membrane protein